MTDPAVRAHFDEVAAEYETNRLGRWYTAHGAYIADRLEGRRFEHVVDVGCGTGWLLRELVRRGIVARGIGLDLSPRMVDEARRLTTGKEGDLLEYAVCDWPNVPEELAARFASDPADLVVFASSLHYADDFGGALRRAFTVLRAGGSTAILERAPERSWTTRVWGWAHAAILRDAARFIATEDLHALLADAGFTDVKVVGWLKRFAWRGKLITSMALTMARAPADPAPPAGGVPVREVDAWP